MLGLVLATETPIDFSGFLSALTTAITPTQLLGILSTAIGAGIAFTLMWFGVRKIWKIFRSSLDGHMNM